MGEHEGYNQAEEARLQEFGQLADAMDEAGHKIEKGRDTSAAQLDKYLSTSAAFYRWMTHNPDPDHPPEERERNAEWYLRYQRVLNGSYQVEKANFALEEARLKKSHAEEQDEYSETSFMLERRAGRKIAANWFRTAANCLTMPEAKPTPPQDATK
jgi:hypothetical protein